MAFRTEVQRRIGAVEELNRGKPQVGIANVLEIVDLVFALAIDEVTAVAGRIGLFDDCPILRVRLRPTWRYYGPEVIQHVTIMGARSGLVLSTQPAQDRRIAIW